MNPNEIPANIDIEKEVIGAMLIRNGEKIPAVLKILSADDFYFPAHQIIFKHIVNVFLQNGNTDILIIIDNLKKSGDLKKIGIEYVTAMIAWTYTNAYILQHAKILKEKSNLRHLMTIATKLFDSAQNGAIPVSEILNTLQDDLQDLTLVETSRISTYKNYFQENFKSEIETSKKYALRKTGFENIDQHQIFSSGLYLIGATPAAGKTTFAWQMAEQLAKNGESCIFCSYEMSRLELFSKSVARELFKRNPSTTLTAADIRRGGWTNEIDKIIEDTESTRCDLRMIELHDKIVDEFFQFCQAKYFIKKSTPEPDVLKL